MNSRNSLRWYSQLVFALLVHPRNAVRVKPRAAALDRKKTASSGPRKDKLTLPAKSTPSLICYTLNFNQKRFERPVATPILKSNGRS